MNRGGLLGIGSRRVMSLGLPLLKILSVSEAKAVIAHEFGHFHGGDTSLGPWIYRTRQALMRTVQTLGERGSVLQSPFRWYGKTFMKITQGISRGQEYTADRLAVQVAGVEAMKSALTALHSKGGAFDVYWRNEFVPALRSGFHPPMLEGYGDFIAQPSIRASLQQSLAEELERGETDTFDSHPSLRDRLAALGKQKSGVPIDDAPAESLLNAPRQIERLLIQILVGDEPASGLQPLRWQEAAEKIWLPVWSKTRDELHDLPEVPLAELPSLLHDRASLAKRLTGEEQPAVWDEERDALLGWLLSAATVMALVREGWQISSLPGEEVTALVGEHRFKPFEMVRKLVTGELSQEDWQGICDEAGVGAVYLAKQECG